MTLRISIVLAALAAAAVATSSFSDEATSNRIGAPSTPWVPQPSFIGHWPENETEVETEVETEGEYEEETHQTDETVEQTFAECSAISSSSTPLSSDWVKLKWRRCVGPWVAKYTRGGSSDSVWTPTCCADLCQAKGADSFTFHATRGRCVCRSLAKSPRFALADCYVRKYPVLIVEGTMNEVYVPVTDRAPNGKGRMWRSVDQKGNFQKRRMYYDPENVGWVWVNQPLGEDPQIVAIAAEPVPTGSQLMEPSDGLPLTDPAWGHVHHAKQPLHTTCVPTMAKRVTSRERYTIEMENSKSKFYKENNTSEMENSKSFDSFMQCATAAIQLEELTGWAYQAYEWHPTERTCTLHRYQVEVTALDTHDRQQMRPEFPLVCLRGTNWLPTEAGRRGRYNMIESCVASLPDQSREGMSYRVWSTEQDDTCIIDDGAVDRIHPVQENWDNARVTMPKGAIGHERSGQQLTAFESRLCGGEQFAWKVLTPDTADPTSGLNRCIDFCQPQRFECLEVDGELCSCQRQCPQEMTPSESGAICYKTRLFPVLIVYGMMNEVYVPTASVYNGRNVWRAVDSDGDFKERYLHLSSIGSAVWTFMELLGPEEYHIGQIQQDDTTGGDYPPDDSDLTDGAWGRVTHVKEPFNLSCVPVAVRAVRENEEPYGVESTPTNTFFECVTAGMAVDPGFEIGGFSWHQGTKQCQILRKGVILVRPRQFVGKKRRYLTLACLLGRNWIPISDHPHQPPLTSIEMQDQCVETARIREPRSTRVWSERLGVCGAQSGDLDSLPPVSYSSMNSKGAYLYRANMGPGITEYTSSICTGIDVVESSAPDALSCGYECRFSDCFEYHTDVLNCYCKNTCIIEISSFQQLPFSLCYVRP